MKKLIIGAILLSTAGIAQASQHSYCAGSANLTKITYQMRLDGEKLSTLMASVQDVPADTRYFVSHAYSIPKDYTLDQAYESGYELCIAAYDSLLAM